MRVKASQRLAWAMVVIMRETFVETVSLVSLDVLVQLIV